MTMAQDDDSLDVSRDATEQPTTPEGTAFTTPPSIDDAAILSGQSYTHLSPLPSTIIHDPDTECVLGIDEAGRGPVLGPMVYATFYLPLALETPLLKTTHAFTDSKALTPATRTHLMRTLCTPTTDLHTSCGWATRVISARDISSGMLRAHGSYNLNAQAMDATIALVHAVLAAGVNATHIFVDTIGRPETYQRALERVFPSKRITVAKKADSLYPCVSAASVCAKVTRDVALEVAYTAYAGRHKKEGVVVADGEGWGSGYPSDARTTAWLRHNMHPLFGWGSECRFSWGTAQELLEGKPIAGRRPDPRAGGCRVEWFDADADADADADDEDDHAAMKLTAFYHGGAASAKTDVWEARGPLANWFGTPATDCGI